MQAEEETFTGVFGRVIEFYSTAMRWVLAHSWVSARKLRSADHLVLYELSASGK